MPKSLVYKRWFVLAIPKLAVAYVMDLQWLWTHPQQQIIFIELSCQNKINSPVSQYERPRAVALASSHVLTKPLKSSLSLHTKILFYIWNEPIKEQQYVASVCHIISLIEFRKPFTKSKCINCIGIQNYNILKKLFHTFIQTVILKLVMLNYG